jgi:hypothetical protein
MARYVILSFEDDNVAEEFVKEMEVSVLTTIDYGREHVRETYPAVKVEAMMQKPTKLCEAGGCRSETTKRVVGFARGKRHGWWICKVCGRPGAAWASSLGAVLGCCVDQLRDRQTQNMEREAANDLIEDYRTSRNTNIGNYPDGGAR